MRDDRQGCVCLLFLIFLCFAFYALSNAVSAKQQIFCTHTAPFFHFHYPLDIPHFCRECNENSDYGFASHPADVITDASLHKKRYRGGQKGRKQEIR